MPPRPLEPYLPTVFLDQWVLSRAIRGDLELRSWIEGVPARGNICLTIGHVLECAAGHSAGKFDLGLAMAEWIETLPYTWLQEHEVVEFEEVRNLLGQQLGIALDPVRFWSRALSERLPLPTSFRQCVVDMRASSGIRQESELEAWANRRLHDDRKRALEAGATQHTDSWLAIKRSVYLELLTRRVLGRQDAQDDESIALVIRAWARDKKTLPALAVAEAFWKAHAERASRAESADTFQKGNTGITRDLFHVQVSAAYVDVFTCDTVVAGYLRQIRELLGRQGPITGSTKGMPPLVERLEMALSRAS